MQITPEVSSRIDLLTFPLILGVVLFHSRFGDINTSTTATGPDFLPTFIYHLFNIFASLAVPLFFTISGFLFFKDYEHTWELYFRKIKTRFRTLLIPYLFWNISLLLVVLSATQIPSLKSFIIKPITDLSLFNIFNTIFSITTLTPISYQFWYIKDLMLIVALSYFIYITIRHIPTIGLLIVFIPWFLGIEHRIFHVRYNTLLFFYLGGLIRFTYQNQLSFIDTHRNVFILSYLTMALVEASLITLGYKSYGYQLHQSIILLGIPAVWGFTSTSLNIKRNAILRNLGGFSFFVFACHEPTMTILRKSFYLFFPPQTSFHELAYWFTLPILTVTTTILIALILRKYSPFFLGAITGQRLPQPVY